MRKRQASMSRKNMFSETRSELPIYDSHCTGNKGPARAYIISQLAIESFKVKLKSKNSPDEWNLKGVVAQC